MRNLRGVDSRTDIEDTHSFPRPQGPACDIGAVEWAPPPELSLMPGIWDFGDVQAGGSALSDPFVVDNTGSSDLDVGMVAIEGPAAGDFQLEDDICFGQTVAPGNFCGFSVRFTPAAAGIRRAEVRVPGNAPSPPRRRADRNSGCGVFRRF